MRSLPGGDPVFYVFVVTDMKLRLDELAKAMDLPRDTLERWIRQGRIPVKKNGMECSFGFATLKSWAGKHNTSFVIEESALPVGAALEVVSLSHVMACGGVVYDLEGDDVSSVLHNMTAFVKGLGEGGRDALFHLLDERENLASTGVGRGVALPHPRTPMDACVTPSITTFFLKRPMDFSAVDDLPVRVLFLILSPDVGVHLQLLSKISFCVREPAFLRFLESAPSEAALLEKVAEFESRL